MLLAAAIGAGGGWVLNEIHRLPRVRASAFTVIPSTRLVVPRGGGNMTPAELFARCSPAVVRVFAFDRHGQRSQGSGFMIDPNGLVITNHHVIEGRNVFQVALADDRLISVQRVVAVDRAADLALLKVSAGDLPALAISGSPLPGIGTRVYAIGSPRDLSNTLSEGLVSGLRRDVPGVTHIQTTAPISPGSSGGPLLNADGVVIGVTSAFRSDGQSLNFAVDTVRVNELLELGRYRLAATEKAGTPAWWLAQALRNATEADETRPAVYLAIGRAAIEAGDRAAAAWAARFAERAGHCGGDTFLWQTAVADLYRQSGQPDRAVRLLESAGIPPSESLDVPPHQESVPESERQLVLACARRAAANEIDAACDIASRISSWRPRAEAVRAIARVLAPQAGPDRVLGWIEQQGDGWEGAQLRAIGCLGPVDASQADSRR